MPIETLTELQYSQDRVGPWKMYLYDSNGFHHGGVWFMAKPKYPEEITNGAAGALAMEAFLAGREIRICDGGDMLVFHANAGKVLYGEDFWHSLGQHWPEKPSEDDIDEECK